VGISFAMLLTMHLVNHERFRDIGVGPLVTIMATDPPEMA
jgi:hypothetical protein